MRRLVSAGLALALLGVAALVSAQVEAPEPPIEIKLDEAAMLKAAALEARMSAIVANFALLQRQAQDLQQELKQILEDRRKLIEDAAKRSEVEVGDANGWMFHSRGQRYLKVKRLP